MIAQPWTVKWGKMLLGAGSNDKVLGTRLELVALKDPFTARPGTTIPVKLLYDGKPFAGFIGCAFTSLLGCHFSARLRSGLRLPRCRERGGIR